MLVKLLLATCSLTSLAAAQANLLQNGDFEVGPPIALGQTGLTIFGTEMPGWRVAYGNVDINSAFWSPSSGLRSVDLHGIERGSIEQVVATTPGFAYEVVFDLGASSGPKSCTVSAAGHTSPVFTHSGPQFPNVTYAPDRAWTFVATDTSTTVRFETVQVSGANGTHIDNVRLYARGGAAGFSAFGAGCAGSSGVPDLHAAGGSRPVLGQTFAAEITALPLSLADPTFLLLATDRAQPPVSLADIGMPGCDLLVQPFDAAGLVKIGGVASWRVPVPSDQGLVGATFRIQAFAFDRAQPGNAFGAAVSNGGELMISTH